MLTFLRRGSRPGGRATLGALLVALWLTLLALPAAAHDSLIDSEPSAEEVVTSAPEELVLTFSGDVSELGVQFVVTGPEGRDVVQGTPTVEGDTVTQELAEELVNGDYEATWRVTSSDGHPISGTIPFTIDADDAAPTDDAATDAPTGESTPTQEPGDSTPTQEPGDSTPTQEPTTDTTPDPGESTSTPSDVDEPTGTGADADAETTAAAAEADSAETPDGIPAWGWLVAVLAAIGLVACGFLAFRRN